MTSAERWDDKYRAIAESDRADLAPPRSAVTDLAHLLPASGRAIDVAGGRGNTALWLAERGLDVVLVDVSEVALNHAAALAAERELSLRVEPRDVETDGIEGTWDVIVVTYFLHRPLLQGIGEHLNIGGSVLFAQPTATNLERHDKPSRRFLLADGEIHELAAEIARRAAKSGRELVTQHATEAWQEGVHEARLVMTRQR